MSEQTTTSTTIDTNRSGATVRRLTPNQPLALSACAIVFATVLSLGNAHAESSIQECDRLAAADYDHQQNSTGISDEALMGRTASNAQAEQACRQAVLTSPENNRARFQLGRVLILGGKSFEGEDYTKMAAESSYLAAAYFLGKSYYRGWIETPNIPEAVNWLTVAAAQGQPDAQHMLGAMYRYGRGTDVDLESAYRLLNEASAQGHAEAGVLLGGMYYEGAYVNRDLKKAFQLFKAAAEKGSRYGQYTAGMMYLQGEGTTKNPTAGLKLLGESAGRNYSLAQIELAKIYHDGELVEKDESKSRHWFCQAGAAGREQYFSLYGKSLSCMH